MLEAWLKSDSLEVQEVATLLKHNKIPEYMVMAKAVGRRTEGMGFKTMNYHGIKHVGWDMIYFGVPANVDTESDEMHHKDDKKSAKQTQKRPDSFDIQSLRRIEDRRLVEFAIEELKGRPRWLYYNGYGTECAQSETSDTQNLDPMEEDRPAECASVGAKLTGVLAKFRYDVQNDACVYDLQTQMKHRKKFTFSPHVQETISEILFDCDQDLACVRVHSELVMPCGQTYRAASHYYGKPWFDWALFRYADGNDDEGIGILPAHIRAFVDLRDLPIPNCSQYKDTIYIIAEPVKLNPDPVERDHPSRIFKPYIKQQFTPSGCQKKVNRLHIYPIDKLVGPVCVIPDLDNESNGAVLRVLSPSKWADELRKWIYTPPLLPESNPQLNTI